MTLGCREAALKQAAANPTATRLPALILIRGRKLAKGAVELAGAAELAAAELAGRVRALGRRRPEATLSEPILSVPTQYAKKPLLRCSE